ncbi:MAG: flagellar protein FlaG [Deltaproteobacteria bacterium]|nr:flagellar protein FlaG [Deltaproteobacteria bacterium]
MLETIKSVTSEAIEPSVSILGSNSVPLEKEKKTVFNTEKTLIREKDHIGSKKQGDSGARIEHIAQAMDNYVQSIRRDLKIQVHQNTGKLIVKVISENDGKVIREIPPEELLDLAAKVEEMMGVLFNENA